VQQEPRSCSLVSAYTIIFRLCCLPIQIKAKYYPIVLLVLFFMFLGASFDIVIGFAVGYMHTFGFFKYLEMSAQRAKVWEGRFPFKNYAREPHFASTDFTSSANNGLPTFVRATAPPASASTFSAFQGKGVKLGTGGDSPANTSA